MSSVFVQFTPQDHDAVKKRLESFTTASNERYVPKLPMIEGRKIGLYGEQAFLRVRPDARFVGRTEIGYDFISRDKTIEIKAYGVNVGRGPFAWVWFDETTWKICTADFIVWVAVQKDYESAFVIGFKGRAEFGNESEFRTFDDISPMTGKPTKANHYLLPLDKVEKFKGMRP